MKMMCSLMQPPVIVFVLIFCAVSTGQSNTTVNEMSSTTAEESTTVLLLTSGTGHGNSSESQTMSTEGENVSSSSVVQVTQIQRLNRTRVNLSDWMETKQADKEDPAFPGWAVMFFSTVIATCIILFFANRIRTQQMELAKTHRERNTTTDDKKGITDKADDGAGVAVTPKNEEECFEPKANATADNEEGGAKGAKQGELHENGSLLQDKIKHEALIEEAAQKLEDSIHEESKTGKESFVSLEDDTPKPQDPTDLTNNNAQNTVNQQPNTNAQVTSNHQHNAQDTANPQPNAQDTANHQHNAQDTANHQSNAPDTANHKPNAPDTINNQPNAQDTVNPQPQPTTNAQNATNQPPA